MNIGLTTRGRGGVVEPRFHSWERVFPRAAEGGGAELNLRLTIRGRGGVVEPKFHSWEGGFPRAAEGKGKEAEKK